MSDKKTIIWMAHVDIYSLWPLLRIASSKKDPLIRYRDISHSALLILQIIDRAGICSCALEKIPYDLADMKIENEATVGMKLQFEFPQYGHMIAQQLKDTELGRFLNQLFPPERFGTLLEAKVFHEILPVLKLTMVAQWYKQQKHEVQEEHILLTPQSGLLSAFVRALSDSSLLIIGFRSTNVRRMLSLLKDWLIMKNINVVLGSSRNQVPKNSDQPLLAVHYVEGFDLSRRSDLYWRASSGLRDEQVLVYFDTNTSFRGPAPAETIKRVEQLGLRWVATTPAAVAFPWRYHWKKIGKAAGHVPGAQGIRRFSTLKNSEEQWLLATAQKVIHHVEWWLAFYKYFNVKVVIDTALWVGHVMEQGIASEMVDAVRAGPQRSTVSMVECLPFMRYNAADVFFVWGRESLRHEGTSPSIKRVVVGGFPFSKIFHRKSEDREFDQKLRDKNVKFILALFDNTYTSDLYISRAMVETFYTRFLEWLLEDPEVGIIIKEKKPLYFDKLQINDILRRAKASGRLIRAGNALGRFPSDVVKGADMAIGLGISSAVMEAVMVGCRGIHCDIIGTPEHYYYDWGTDRLIFRDIERLIAALKIYKKDRSSMAHLGFWGDRKDEINPFCDDRSGERIGKYLFWLLEGFSADKSRDDVLDYADAHYISAWGKGSVVRMSSGRPLDQDDPAESGVYAQ